MLKVGKFTIHLEKVPHTAKAVASKIASLPKKTSHKIALWYSARVSAEKFANMSEDKQKKVLENLEAYATEKSESMLRNDASLGAQRDEYEANINRINSLEFRKKANSFTDEFDSRIEELKNRNDELEQEFEQKRKEYEQSILENKYEPFKNFYDVIQQASILPEENEEFELPEKISKNLNLPKKSGEEFELSEKIIKNLNLPNLKSGEEFELPEKIDGDLNLEFGEESLEEKAKKYMGIDLSTIIEPISSEKKMKTENGRAIEDISDIISRLTRFCASSCVFEYTDKIYEIIKICNDKIEEEKKINSSLSSDLSETNIELKKVKEDNKDLSEKNKTLLHENDILEKSNNSRSETIKQQYEELASKDEIIKSLKEELANTKSMYETEHSLNESLRSERTHQQKEVAALRDRLDKLSEQTEILMKSNSMVSQNLTSSKAKEILTQARDEFVSQSERLATKEELEYIQKLGNEDVEIHKVNRL